MSEQAFKDTFSRDKIKNLMKSGVKSAFVLDAASRIESVYEAPIQSAIGDPCLVTSFKYLDGAGGTSRVVVATQEKVVAWPGFEIVQVGAGNDFDLLA
jgi:hypothetical protein